jgi:hypothetical protein
MAVPYKPHSISAYAPIEGSDTGDGVEVTSWDETPVSVSGMVEPITAAVAYTDYALECQRPLRLFADVNQESAFPVGAVFSWSASAGTKWGRVVAPPIVYDAEPSTSHIVVLADRWAPVGTELDL